MADINSEMLSEVDCPKTGRVDKLYAGDVVDLEVQFLDPNHCPVDVSRADGFEGTEPEDRYDEAGNVLIPRFPGRMPPGWTAWYVAKPTYTLDRDLIVIPMKEMDASKGLFSVNVYGYMQQRPPNPGIYRSEAVVRDERKRARFRAQRWLDIRPTLDYNSVGPLTEAEIRMAMRDFGCLNTLTDEVEFAPEEVYYAINHAVDIWNSTPPFVRFHTPASFPYRGEWLIGAVGYLLSAGALSRLRNQMQIQGDNVSITDHAHGDAYERIGRDYTARYENWVKTAKVAVNMNMGFGTLGSRYAGLV